jgi:hypothetical protein
MMPRRRRTIWLTASLLVTLLAGMLFHTEPGIVLLRYLRFKILGGYSLEQRIALHAGDVEGRLRNAFVAADLHYPPRELAFLAFKDQRLLTVFARDTSSSNWAKVVSYPILGLSGRPGPKLAAGDGQVPEGSYRAVFLHPNSRFHLAIRLDYPNDYDRARADEDARTDLGSDIMIHGSSSSVGCLAMGDQAAEDLFILAALAGQERVKILIAPTDLRRATHFAPPPGPLWVNDLYQRLRVALDQFPG